MHGFFFHNLEIKTGNEISNFKNEIYLYIEKYCLSFSAENSVHNFNSYDKDTAPFVFIYGEVSNYDALGHERFDNDFARWLSLYIKSVGIAAINILKGLFAVLVFDPSRDTIWIYTDNVGGFCTPYYRFFEGSLSCSSSFKIIADNSESLRVDAESLSCLISTGYVLPENTLAEGVQKMRPGCLMTVTADGLLEEQISVISFEASRNRVSQDSGEGHILSYMEKFITGDSCFLLSGGLDSSTLVAMVAKHFGCKVNCCSGVFSGFGDLDESGYAKIVADHCSVDLHCFELGHETVLQNLPEIVEAIGEPFLDDSILPTYALFKEIKKNFNTVFSGDGPDHLFNRYYALATKRTLGSILNFIPFIPKNNKYINRLLRSSSEDIEFAYSELFALPYWTHNRRSDMLKLLHVNHRRESNSSYLIEMNKFHNKFSHNNNMECINFADFYIDGSFGVFSKVGKAASALELHIREPYLASSFADFAASLPMEEKIRGGFFSQVMSKCTTKLHLREVISRKYLPDVIINRRKGGFTPPLESWLQDFLRNEQVLKRFSDVSKSCLNLEFVEEIFRNFLRNNTHGGLIFMLISFDLWIKIFIEHRTMKDVRLKDVYC